ncbi:MAG: efflux RND transporter periplasmic adaptor subunit [Ruminobacter sp.]|nr:efflux RND transporter periplasmic adaptor subunit [Ruminobacter sp.]
MKKYIIILLIAISVVSVIAFKFIKKEEPKYLTITPTRTDVVSKVVATGKLVGRSEVNVGAQVNGQLQKLYVELGDKVKKDDLIAEIDPRTQNNALLTAKANLKVEKASKAQKVALLKQQQSEYDRQLKMRTKNATSEANLEVALANLEQTKAAITLCDANIEKAQLSVDNAITNLGYTTIRAPRDGVVIGIVTEEGQTVVSNQSAPTIVKLADLETMTVEAEISEADVVKIKPGMNAYFTILGMPDKKFHSSLRQIEPGTAAESSSTSNSSSASGSSTAIYYNALLDVPNKEGILRVSMTAEVTIVLGESKNALTLPIAVLDRKVGDDQYKIRVLDKDNNLQEKLIKVGMKDNIHYEILEGLEDDDRVVIGNDIESAEAKSMLDAESRRKNRPPRF